MSELRNRRSNNNSITTDSRRAAIIKKAQETTRLSAPVVRNAAGQTPAATVAGVNDGKTPVTSEADSHYLEALRGQFGNLSSREIMDKIESNTRALNQTQNVAQARGYERQNRFLMQIFYEAQDRERVNADITSRVNEREKRRSEAYRQEPIVKKYGITGKTTVSDVERMIDDNAKKIRKASSVSDVESLQSDNRILKSLIDRGSPMRKTEKAKKKRAYESLMDKKDFVEKSKKIVNTRNYDNKYVRINGLEGSVLFGGDMDLEGSSYGKYDFMSQDEIDIYNYLYNTGGKSKANEYLELIEPELDEKFIKQESQKWEGYGKEHPAANWVMQRTLAPTRAVVGLVDTAGNAVKYAKGEEINPNSNMTYLQHIRDAGDTAAASGLAEKYTAELPLIGNVASFMYSTSASMGDNLMEMAVTAPLTMGGSAVLKGVDVGIDAMKYAKRMQTASKYIISAMMAGDVAQRTILDSKEKGYSDGEALALGISSAIVEGATEKFSLDAIMRHPKGVASALARGFVAEGSEEGVASAANMALGYMIKGSDSDISKQIAELKNNGYSDKRAVITAIAQNIVPDMLAGGLSGMGMSAGYHGAGAVASRPETTRLGATVRKNGVADAVIDAGLKHKEKGSAASYAKKLDKTRKSGKEVSDYQVGKMMELNLKEDAETGKFYSSLGDEDYYKVVQAVAEFNEGERQNLFGYAVSSIKDNYQNRKATKEQEQAEQHRVSEIGRQMRESENDILKEGLSKKAGTEARKNAEKLSKQKSVSDYELGRQVELNKGVYETAQAAEPSAETSAESQAPITSKTIIEYGERLSDEGATNQEVNAAVRSVRSMTNAVLNTTGKSESDSVKTLSSIVKGISDGFSVSAGKKRANTAGVARAVATVLSSPDGAFTEDTIRALAEHYVARLAANDSMAYREVSKVTDNLADSLVRSATGQELAPQILENDAFRTLARLFDKDVSKAIGLIKAAHTSFYGDQPIMDAQMTQYFSGNKSALVTPVTVDESENNSKTPLQNARENDTIEVSNETGGKDHGQRTENQSSDGRGRTENLDNNRGRNHSASDSGTTEALSGTQGRSGNEGNNQTESRAEESDSGFDIRSRRRVEKQVGSYRVAYTETDDTEYTKAIRDDIAFGEERGANVYVVEDIVVDGEIRANGFTANGTDVYYNGDSHKFAHELAHLIKKVNGASFEELKKTVKEHFDRETLDKILDGYMDTYEKAYGRDKEAATEEFLCDICGNIYVGRTYLKGQKVSHFEGAVRKYFDSVLKQKATDGESEGDLKLNVSDVKEDERGENLNASKNTGDLKLSVAEDILSEYEDEYMDAYYDGDDERAQEILDTVAERLGYKYKAYHHTENAFNVFDLSKARTSMDIQGFFFSADPEAEREYGSVRYDTYLKMENPYIVDSKEKAKAIPFDMSKSDSGITAREWLQENGYDGIIRKAEYYGAEADEYVVFEPSQIKSAEPYTYTDDENGEGDIIPLSERFNPENNDIRFSLPDDAESEEYAPVFYSKMERTIQEMKQDKIGASSVVNYLKGKGVKDEEIKWSGIEAFLDGKKSVTKAELQEFVAGSQLQIEEMTFGNSEIPYTAEQQEEIDFWTKKLEQDRETIMRLWQEAFDEEFPGFQNIMSMGDNVLTLLKDKIYSARDKTPEGKAYKKAAEEIKEMIKRNDYFGFDSLSEAFRTVARNPSDFSELWDMDESDRDIARRYAKAQEGFRSVDLDSLKKGQHNIIETYAERMTAASKKIIDVRTQHYADKAKHMPKWGEYTLDGGENYREIVFKMPNSTYTNQAMAGHWEGTAANGEGILAHARIQDFEVDGKKMLFIEEIQSDWHNEGHKKGYRDTTREKSLWQEYQEIQRQNKATRKSLIKELTNRYEGKVDDPEGAAEHFIDYGVNGFLANHLVKKYDIPAELVDRAKQYAEAVQKETELLRNANVESGIEDAPFRNNYHEYVLKNLIRMAAEQGYDSIGWTPADVQSKRWSDDFAEGYRIEYDQDIPKFLNKYGKKWGAKVGKTQMAINGETEATYYVDDSGNRGVSYSQLIDDILARHGIDESEFNDYSAVFVTDDTIKIRNPKDGSYLDEEIHMVTESSTVWSMPITEAMKESVLYEGQPKFSLTEDTDYILQDLETEEDYEKAIEQLIEKYGRLKSGENPVRDAMFPKSDTSGGRKAGVRSSRDVSGADSDERWTTERVESDEDKKKSYTTISDIVKAIREKFGIPIATGKVSDAKASGIYKETPETVRVRIANNLPTISHELGHHLDKKYGFSSLDSVSEIEKAVPEGFLEQYSEEERNGESVAEFVRIYLKNTNEASRMCPDFYSDFVSSLSKEDLKAINEIASVVNEYLSSDFSERVDAHITNAKEMEKEKIPFREKWSKWYTDWVDAFHPQKQAVDYVEEKTGKTLSGNSNAYVLATNSLDAHTVANYLICDGFRDLEGNLVEAKSFVDSIGMVDSKDIKLLDRYLVLKHSLEWIAPVDESVKKKRVFGDDTLEDVERIRTEISNIEKSHPEIKTAAENLYAYQNNVLKYFVIPAGGMTEDTLAKLNKMYPSYVPFFRAVSKTSGLAKGTFANQPSPIMRAKGSGEVIISPVESIIKNTEKMVKFALRNQVMLMWAEYADTVDGFGQFMEKVPPDMVPHVVGIAPQKKAFAEALQQVIGSAEDYFAVSSLLDDVFGDAVTGYSVVANAGNKVVTVRRDGKASYYQIHDETFYNSVAELSPKQTSGLLKISHDIMQPMKILITQNNPIFAVTNALRDFGSAYKLSEINNPAVFAAQYAKALKEIISRGENYQQFKAMGGGHSSELTANIENISRTLREVAMKDMGKARRLAYSIFRHPVETIAAVNDIVESTPRFMEFQRTLDEGGDLQKAIFNASDITTNFRRHGEGDTAKTVNSLIMFNNAAMQGLDKTFRTLTEKDKKKRYKTLLKWMLHALIMAIIGHVYNKAVDDEGYQNLSSYKKNNFYNFAIGDGKFVSIPKPRENALLDTLTERTIEYVFGGNENAFYDFGNYLTSQLLPPMLPDSANPVDAVHSVLGSTILGGLVDVGFNKDFKGSPIEGAYDRYIPSNERYTDSTTMLAYGLGQTRIARSLDMSPKKIDHLISSYTGILGQVNKALAPMSAERRDHTIGLRNKFISDSNYSTDVLNRMYENTDKAEKKFMFSGDVSDAVEYEQNVIVTSYISGMNKAVKALPADQQRKGRALLLKTLNGWNYNNTESQTEMIEKLDGKKVSKKWIVDELPSSELTWSENKVEYTYQMTPQEYDEYVKDYLTMMEKYRLQQNAKSDEKYTEALEKTNAEVKKALNKKYKQRFREKATTSAK